MEFRKTEVNNNNLTEDHRIISEERKKRGSVLGILKLIRRLTVCWLLFDGSEVRR